MGFVWELLQVAKDGNRAGLYARAGASVADMRWRNLIKPVKNMLHFNTVNIAL